MTILHVTDCHLTEYDEREPEEIRDTARTRAEAFKSQLAGEGTALENFRRLIERASEQGEGERAGKIDFTVFTGDIIDFPSQANLETLRDAFSRLPSPYLYTLGNHDWNFGAACTDEDRQAAYPMFREWSSAVPGCEVRELDGVKLIAIDNGNYQVTQEQFDAVSEAASSGLPYLLFMHIPLYVQGLVKDVVKKWGAPIMMGAAGWDPDVREAWQVRHQDDSTGAFCRWLGSPDSGDIRGIFCGHVHLDHIDAFREGRYQYVTAPGYTNHSRLIRLIPE
ncbi:metallophosphoesterase [Paenibacillus sp. MWE-103]|uniref:Metallophosphoesterase n=1 Tax=Paenibacillus artemisiicola TaxID=1172618 RepID=A0ABS3W457_9BACL|nr:metallophosphoesterase [Paenibacillus artemisiicola]MBO7743085.1 metallophosphoesterase [Paenibacillus artemisiicola]